MTGNHREQRVSQRPTSASAPVAGKRRAEKPQRMPLGGKLPGSFLSLPLVAGVAVLAIATSGAVSAADADLTSRLGAHAAQANTAASISAADSPRAQREPQVSRSSRRTGATEETDPHLVKLAQAQEARYQKQLAQMRRAGDKQAAKIKENKWVLPLASYSLTATFGQYGLWASYHTGLDFNGESGDPIVSIANGVVKETGYAGAYGNRTVITLDDGTEIWYAHQTSIHVSPGQSVRGGEVIGTVGSTGNSTGSHLHLEVRPGGGDPVDPFQAFVDHGIVP